MFGGLFRGSLGVNLDEAVPLNAELLDIIYTPPYSPLDLSPQEKRNRTLQALADQLCAVARRAPTLFVLEDAHWVDPSTLELVELILRWFWKDATGATGARNRYF